MSIQFRTRSQTTVDYSRFINQNGQEPTGCCYVYDSVTNTVSSSSKSLSQCNQVNGYFLSGECDENTNITPSTKGCCCASKNIAEGSYLKQTTFCECQDRSGLWNSGDCPTQETTSELDRLCISPVPESLDYRNKRACCHPEFTNYDGVVATCTDVDTEKECAEKAIFPYTATFYKSGRRCNEQVGNASPAINDCKLSTTGGGKIINSCVNGTNIYSWSLKNFSNTNNKKWYDGIFQNTYLEATEQNVFYTDNENPNNEANKALLILGPYTSKSDPVNNNNYASGYQVIKPLKITAGGYSENENLNAEDRLVDGYFAIIDHAGIPVYYSSPDFTSLFSPIPLYNEIEPAIDIIATKTFSAFITRDNKLKIFGRFYDKSINEYRTLTVTDKLKKIYRHNLEAWPATQDSLVTIGFVGQKLDGSFEYYSPFLTQSPMSPKLQQLKNMVRTIQKKDYITGSLGAYTFCGIDSTSTLICNSLNTEINPPLTSKFKLVTCQNQNNAAPTPDKDFCYAVTDDNRIIRLSSTDEFFDLDVEPKLSITDVKSISCIYGHCDMVVTVDETTCNSQMLGSCCTCVNQSVNCEPKSQGECVGAGGHFVSGGMCPESCSNVVGICDGSQTFLRSSRVESTLPQDELTYFNDGLYVGIFEPGVPVNTSGSTVRGNQFTGIASEYKPSVVGYGTTTKRWAIVVAPFDYEMNGINDATEFTETIPASMYDGLWNTYGDSNTYYGIQSKAMEELRNFSKLSGWYLPSKNELEFINYKINHGFIIPELFKSFNNGIYLTSTPYFEFRSNSVYNLDSQIFGGQGFMYGQSFSKVDYGYTYLVPREKKINVRLIKRIELE